MTEPTLRPFKFLVCVDNRPESRIALRLACEKAKRRGGLVDIVHVIAPADFQSLPGVAERMREEQRAEAETMMNAIAAETLAAVGLRPGIQLREGVIGDGILAAAMEDHDITMLALGVAADASSRGKLVGWLASQLGSRLFVPLLLVPGNLTDQQLEALI
jgi:nucleotide-binding universal stress UspA family protein